MFKALAMNLFVKTFGAFKNCGNLIKIYLVISRSSNIIQAHLFISVLHYKGFLLVTKHHSSLSPIMPSNKSHTFFYVSINKFMKMRIIFFSNHEKLFFQPARSSNKVLTKIMLQLIHTPIETSIDLSISNKEHDSNPHYLLRQRKRAI